MLSIYDEASASDVLARPLNPTLQSLISDRLHDAEVIELGELTHILVIEPGDTEEAIRDELGWSPLENVLDGCRFGTADFVPYWSWLQDLGGWYEMIVTVGNSGFAFILLIERTNGVLPELLRLCREFSDEPGRCG